MAEPRTTIHDLGYEPYRGAKTPHRGRFWVIARNVFAVAWKAKWVVRVPLFATVGIVITCAVILSLLQTTLTLIERDGGFGALFRAEVILHGALRFFELAAAVLTAVVATAAIANDLRMGSFQFYFSRPVRRRDYVTGKLLGLILLVGIPMFAGPVIVSIMIVIMAWTDAGEFVHLIPETMGFGLYATLAYVIPAAGIGALVKKRHPALAVFAIYYLFVSTAAVVLSVPLRFPWLRLVSIANNLDTFGRWLYGTPQLEGPPVWAALLALGLFVAGGLALIWARVSRAETAGMGQQ